MFLSLKTVSWSAHAGTQRSELLQGLLVKVHDMGVGGGWGYFRNAGGEGALLGP